MNETTKSVLSAAGVLAAVAATLGGSAWRSKIDAPGSESLSIGTFLASKTKDDDVSEVAFFHEMTKLLKREYVDPITDDEKLASGAVRGMVSSLGDPESLYYDKNEFKAFNDARKGSYEGIGAVFAMRMSPSGKVEGDSAVPTDSADTEAPAITDKDFSVPQLLVAALVPGGPAEKAGVKVGDIVSFVDDHWIVDAPSIRQFREDQKLFGAGKMTREEYAAKHKALRLKFEKNILPLRAKDRLTMGTQGTVNVVWLRGNERIQTTITKAATKIAPFESSGNMIERLSFADGVDSQLRDAVAGQSAVTIDLRNNVDGDFEAMKKCLSVIAPTGEYGFVVSDKDKKPATLAVTSGNSHPPKLKILVDQSTGGAAEVFAMALKGKGLATLDGGPMSPDRAVSEVFTLPDGTGYSLVTGHFSLTDGAKHAARALRERRRIALLGTGGNA